MHRVNVVYFDDVEEQIAFKTEEAARAFMRDMLKNVNVNDAWYIGPVK